MSEAGHSKGLKIILDAHSDQLSFGTVQDHFKGFTTTISKTGAVPITSQDFLLIKPGYSTSFAITAEDITSDEELLEVDPLKRNCYFHHEKSLKLFKEYSYANCLFECKLDYGQAKTNCTPWYFPGSYL